MSKCGTENRQNYTPQIDPRRDAKFGKLMKRIILMITINDKITINIMDLYR